MIRRLLLAAAVALVVAPGLLAQDGLRSASLPERPVATPPPGPRDLFRATPETYRPHPERPLVNPHPVIGGPFYPYVDVAPPLVAPVRARGEERVVRIEIVAPRPPEPAPASVAPIVTPPPVRKTLYVIPRCYAGDKPPDATTSCDRTKLRTIR